MFFVLMKLWDYGLSSERIRHCERFQVSPLETHLSPFAMDGEDFLTDQQVNTSHFDSPVQQCVPIQYCILLISNAKRSIHGLRHTLFWLLTTGVGLYESSVVCLLAEHFCSILIDGSIVYFRSVSNLLHWTWSEMNALLYLIHPGFA